MLLARGPPLDGVAPSNAKGALSNGALLISMEDEYEVHIMNGTLELVNKLGQK